MKTETEAEKVRGILREADHARSVARWAEGMQCSIRLGRPIKLAEMKQRGPFGRKHKYLYELDDQMPADAVDAIYEALGIVRDESERRASELDARLTTTPSHQPIEETKA